MVDLTSHSRALALIPAELHKRLLMLRSTLEMQGAVQKHLRHGKRVFRLRFRQFDEQQGFVIQRAVGLGDDVEVADAVHALIQGWRFEGAAAENAQHELEREKIREEADLRSLVKLTVAAQGGGRKRQRKAMKMWDEAASSGPRELWTLAMQQSYLEVGVPGRPHKALW